MLGGQSTEAWKMREISTCNLVWWQEKHVLIGQWEKQLETSPINSFYWFVIYILWEALLETSPISSSSLQVIVVDPEAYTYDDEVLKKAEAMGKPGVVEIHAKEDSFIFTVETTGAVKASQLVLNAIEVLKQKLDAVRLSDDTVEADDQFGELGAHMRGG